MIKLLVAAAIIRWTNNVVVADIAVYPYASFGIGTKVDESEYWHTNDEGSRLKRVDFGNRDTALFEFGVETDYNITIGIKHDSQYSSGWPFNNDAEYYKTEIFIRYTVGGRK